MVSQSFTQLRARSAALSRSRRPDDPEYIEVRRDLKEIRLERYIRRIVDEAPPFTEAQRSRLARLLRSSNAPESPV